MGGDSLRPGDLGLKDRIGAIIEGGADHEAEAVRGIAALGAAGGRCPERRLLAAALDRRKVIAARRVLAGLAAVGRRIEEAHRDAVLADKATATMGNTLGDSERRSSHLIAESNALAVEIAEADLKRRLVTAFIDRFKLTPAESGALHGLSKDAPLKEDFFDGLRRVEELHADCRRLAHCGMDAAAVDLMDNIGLHREAAAERLYRWSQRAARTPRTEPLLPVAMAHLRRRPVLFKSVLDEYCVARKAETARAFIVALTEGEDGRGPIELLADRPPQYATEILQRVERVPAIERAALDRLTAECDPPPVEEKAAALAEVCEALRHPLEVRFDLMLSSNLDAKILRGLADSLSEAATNLEREIPGGVLPMTLAKLKGKAEEAFAVAVARRVEAELSRGVRAPPTDLSPSATVAELSGFLREILSVSRTGENASATISSVIDPLLRAVDETACHLPTPDMAVYLLNCLYRLECAVSLCGSAGDQLERIAARADAQIDALTSEQASRLVAELNLGPIYPVLREKTERPLSTVPGVDAPSLKLFALKFDQFLADPDAISLPQIGLLMSSAARGTVRRRSFDVIVAIYRDLYEAVANPGNRYENPEILLPRTPDDVALALSACS